MIARREDHLFLVVNAACKDADFAHLMTHSATAARSQPLPDHALLALQGPKAVTALPGCARIGDCPS